MYILASKWFPTLIRQFFFSIDKIVFNFISQIYDLLITIARTSVLSQADILDMADRIYKLLAVFMIFKVTLSLITYVVNPDDFSDKSKGVSKLGMNIVISLSLLILTPYIFNYAYELQTIVLEDNSMATLIFGDKTDDGFLTSAGDDMAFMTISPFFTPNVSIDDLSECIEVTKKDDNGNIVFNDACSGLDPSYKPKSNNENSLYALIKDGKNFDEKTLQNYVAGVENGSLGLMFREDMAIATSKIKGEEVYVMEYKYIFSTVIGVVVCLLLISFCMDVGVRSIKLAFLQLVAPIPIISYVDPKSGKDGLFKKWYQMCFKTYISLFVRLLAIYFAVYIISMVADLKLVDIVDGSYVTNGLVSIFIIIGALMFAKQLPKILEGLGIKLDGDGKFMLNPLRKMEKDMLGGGILKKPNDSLAKFAKGGFGMGTFSRKMLSGANAAYHGKGFKNGFDRYKGGLGKWIDKQRESYLPYGFEASKKAKEGREEVAAMSSKWSKGEAIYQKMDKKGYNDSSLDGLNKDAYRTAGFNDAFLESKMNLDKATEQQKILNRIYQARQMGTNLNDAIEQEKENIEKYDLDPTKFNTDNKLYKEVDATNKKVSGMEKVHESMRKQDQNQAAIEDQLKFVKYNHEDPTHPGTFSILEKNKSNSSSDDLVLDDLSPDNSDQVNDSISSHYVPDSGGNTQETIDNNVGVNRTSTVDMGAFDPNSSALVDFFESNTTEEEKIRRIEIENKITQTKQKIETLKEERSKVHDGNSYMDLTRQIQTLTRELEDLRRQL